MRPQKILLLILSFCSISVELYGITESQVEQKPITLPLEVIRVINHDSKTYTQGLYYDGDIRFESSGLYGKSFIRRFDQNGQKTHMLDFQFFAEGLTVINNTLYLLTWKAEQLLLFDKTTLKPKGSIRYKGQGWGLTHNDKHFIMSNGSNRLSFRNLESFEIEKTVIVPGIDKLNELEYVDGIIWANSWYNDTVYAIDEQTACIVGKLDVSQLRRQAVQSIGDNVTNGIAYKSSDNTLLITGKRWEKQYFVLLPKLPQTTDNLCFEKGTATTILK